MWELGLFLRPQTLMCPRLRNLQSQKKSGLLAETRTRTPRLPPITPPHPPSATSHPLLREHPVPPPALLMPSLLLDWGSCLLLPTRYRNICVCMHACMCVYHQPTHTRVRSRARTHTHTYNPPPPTTTKTHTHTHTHTHTGDGRVDVSRPRRRSWAMQPQTVRDLLYPSYTPHTTHTAHTRHMHRRGG